MLFLVPKLLMVWDQIFTDFDENWSLEEDVNARRTSKDDARRMMATHSMSASADHQHRNFDINVGVGVQGRSNKGFSVFKGGDNIYNTKFSWSFCPFLLFC